MPRTTIVGPIDAVLLKRVSSQTKDHQTVPPARTRGPAMSPSPRSRRARCLAQQRLHRRSTVGRTEATIALKHSSARPAITCTLSNVKPRSHRHGIVNQTPRHPGSAPSATARRSVRAPDLGIKIREQRPRVGPHINRGASKAAAMQSAVMSSWVGPIPPEVKTRGHKRSDSDLRRPL